MKPWSAFYDLLLPDVPGCPEPAADVALRLSASDFCTRAKAWRVTLDPVDVEAGETEYDFDIGTEEEVVQIIEARVNDQPYPVCRDLRDKDGLRFINSQTFAVPATLSVGASITLDVFLRPTHTAKGVEDFLFVGHADAIASGAKARLMRSPKKPYTDFNLAALHEQLVAQEVNSALVKRFYGHGNTWARVPPQFI